MCTVKLPPAARVTGPQDSTWPGGAAGLTVHEPGPVSDWDSIDQVTPGAGVPAGNGSLTVTPVACPAPVLVTVTWNPIGSPAFTDGASAVLVMWIDAWLQVMPAED